MERMLEILEIMERELAEMGNGVDESMIPTDEYEGYLMGYESAVNKLRTLVNESRNGND